MKIKHVKLSLLILASMFLCGCSNQYFVGNSADEEFYGAFRSIDFSHCDIQLYSTKTNKKCAGVLFIDNSKKAEKDDNGVKWSEAFSSLTCNDGTLLNINWKARTVTNWNGEGYDQYNKKYEFRVITKKAYQKLENSQKIEPKSYEILINQLVKY